jgi:hypothetical protein
VSYFNRTPAQKQKAHHNDGLEHPVREKIHHIPRILIDAID